MMTFLLALAFQDVTLTTDDAYQIAATYTCPKEPKGAVILVHMLAHDRSTWDAFIKEIENDYEVIAIDMRGHGKSEGDRKKFKAEDWAAIAHDIAAAHKYLKSKKVAVIGASIGANLALRYAAAHKEIVGAALLSAGEKYHDVTTFDTAEKFDRPLFVAASEDDGDCAKDAATIAGKATGKSTVAIYKSAGHGTDMFGKEETPGDLTKQLKAWLAEVLK